MANFAVLSTAVQRLWDDRDEVERRRRKLDPKDRHRQVNGGRFTDLYGCLSCRKRDGRIGRLRLGGVSACLVSNLF